MRWRLWINWIALVGVLMHAALVVRHHQVMLSAELERQGLLGSLAAICHSDGQTRALPDAELPSIPAPYDQTSHCPLCIGLASAVVLAKQTELDAPVRLASALVELPRYDQPALRVAGFRPPTRGPPA